MIYTLLNPSDIMQMLKTYRAAATDMAGVREEEQYGIEIWKRYMQANFPSLYQTLKAHQLNDILYKDWSFYAYGQLKLNISYFINNPSAYVSYSYLKTLYPTASSLKLRYIKTKEWVFYMMLTNIIPVNELQNTIRHFVSRGDDFTLIEIVEYALRKGSYLSQNPDDGLKFDIAGMKPILLTIVSFLDDLDYRSFIIFFTERLSGQDSVYGLYLCELYLKFKIAEYLKLNIPARNDTGYDVFDTYILRNSEFRENNYPYCILLMGFLKYQLVNIRYFRIVSAQTIVDVYLRIKGKVLRGEQLSAVQRAQVSSLNANPYYYNTIFTYQHPKNTQGQYILNKCSFDTCENEAVKVCIDCKEIAVYCSDECSSKHHSILSRHVASQPFNQ